MEEICANHRRASYGKQLHAGGVRTRVFWRDLVSVR
jgi:hypothetical protein